MSEYARAGRTRMRRRGTYCAPERRWPCCRSISPAARSSSSASFVSRPTLPTERETSSRSSPGRMKPLATARRECVEEIGVAPDVLVELFSYLTSPGLIDEEITLFLGIVDAARVPAAPPAAAEHEATALLRVPIDAALAALPTSAVRNGPLIVALQWLALNRGRLADIARAGTISR